MRKTLLILVALLVSVGIFAANVIMTLPDPNLDNNPQQKGWSVDVGKIAEAKYLVFETNGGSSADGFGGIQLAFQGGGDEANLGWSQTGLNGDWVSFPREEGKIVSIVIDIESTMGAKYETFLGCTSWAEIIMGHWSPDFAGLGIQNVYLTEGFSKPADAVDLVGTGADNFGFIFEGSVVESVEAPDFVETGKILISEFDGFADDAIVTITISATNEDGWAAGWGVGRINDIAFAKDGAEGFTTIGINLKETSPEGSLNSYEYTVGELKAMASVLPAELEALKAASGKEFGTDWTVDSNNYIANAEGEIGVAVNIWGSGTRVSVTVKNAPAPPPTFVLDFESDEIGTVYPAAINEDRLTATIENRPDGEGKALHVIHLDWDAYPQFSVEFPEGNTLADVEKISFEIYFEEAETVGGQNQNDWKSLLYCFGPEETTFVKEDGISTGNFFLGASNNPKQTWLKREFVPTISENLLSLDTFEFGFGLGINASGNYYLDNIAFVLKEVGIVTVKPFVSRVYGTEGGVVVNAVNENVSIYNFDGRLVKQANANENMISLTKGLYIVKVGADKAMKVLVK